MSGARDRRLLERMSECRVLVVGDAMLDEFVSGEVTRVSPEAPVPVVKVTDSSDRPGGAANVARNVRALGARATLCAVVGDDGAGDRLRAALQMSGVDDALVSGPVGWPTTVKTRILAHHQQIVRADREAGRVPPPALEQAVVAAIRSQSAACDAIVVSDYAKGVVTRAVMNAVRAAGRRHDLTVLVDPKVPHIGLYRGVDVLTPNQAEAAQAAGMNIDDAKSLLAVGRRLLKRTSCGALVVTRGEQGMTLFRQGRRPLHLPTAAREVYDVTGAGDTVIATLAVALAAGGELASAARLANAAAGVAVAKLGTATASPEELLAVL